MCERKAFPSPCPSAAPLTNPAISTTFKNAGTLLKKKIIASKCNDIKYFQIFVIVIIIN